MNQPLPPGICHLCANLQDFPNRPAPLVGLRLESLDGQVRSWRICPVCHLAVLKAMRQRYNTLPVLRT